MSLYSNATVWELKKQIASALHLSPQFVWIDIDQGAESRSIKDVDNGRTLADMGIKANEVLVASKIKHDEEIPKAPLLGPDKKMVPKLVEIFGELFKLYSKDGFMSPSHCSLFIKGCTGEQPDPDDPRIQELFKTFD